MNRVTQDFHVAAVLSMLHEGCDINSATRIFRRSPVLEWTLERLSQARGLGSMAILCWEDQLHAVRPVAAQASAHILAKNPRHRVESMEAIAAAQRWADGWRGGLLNTCHFDQGFFGPWAREILQSLKANAAVLVDPASALVDPALIDGLIERADANPALEMVFSPAAPGLCGVLLRPAMLDRLCKTSLHPGKLLHYLPDAPAHDPCSGDGCVPPPTPVARTVQGFKLDSQRRIDRISHATTDLNGQLIRSAAENLVARAEAAAWMDSMPREVMLELNLQRQSRAIHRPAPEQIPHRPSLSVTQLQSIFSELGPIDDLRLTLGGVGDPLLADHCFEVIEAASRHGIRAIHLQTDLLGVTEDAVRRLAASEVDVVSVDLPAVTAGMYQNMMGVDALAEVMGNIRLFMESRRQNRRLTPILVPTFVKCKTNLAEMEAWYDQWLRALGAAVILGPGDFGGLIEDPSVASMAPPVGKARSRMADRLVILSDGRVVLSDQDVLGRRCAGRVGEQSIGDLWRESFEAFRADLG